MNKDTTKTKTARKPQETAAVIDTLGIDALFAQNDSPEFMANLGEIEIVEQVRDKDEMEDDEQDLAGLGESLLKYQIQAIFLRIMPAGHPKPYRLIAGERRYRAAQLVGLTQLRAKARELDDEEAEDIQFAENIHRKNLTQIQEAKKIQRDLDKLGSVEAVLKKHNKSRAWLSKLLSLLTLPEQTKRLVSEKISADVEVINTVKTVEKHDPKAAKRLVDDLKNTRGKQDARKQANAVKEAVKPSKKPAKGAVATAADSSRQEPGKVTIGTLPGVEEPALKQAETTTATPAAPHSAANELSSRAPALAPAQILSRAYSSIFEFGSSPKMVLQTMQAHDRKNIETWLESFYSAGKQEKNMSRAVMQGFRKGTFATDGDAAFALLAFLQGADASVKSFNLLDLFDLVKE